MTQQGRMASDDPTPAQNWFEMADLRRLRFATSIWIPLRASVKSRNGNATEEFFGLGCVAFPAEHKEAAEKLGWSDLGIGHGAAPYAFKPSGYKPCDVYQWRDEEDLGIELVFEQHITGHPRVWHINPDLVMALGLLEEGDLWLRPSEGYEVVMRRLRDAHGQVSSIEIRSEFLKDYLAARALSLRLAYYRQRQAVLRDASHISWAGSGIVDRRPHDKFEARVFEVDETGGPYGATFAIFRAWRTDAELGDDVPVLGTESDGNTASQSTYGSRQGTKHYRVEGELWREEWIEPGARSERVRGDEAPDDVHYIVDAAGTREASRALDNEDIGRWLWFDPRIFNTIHGRRGAHFEWYTRYTGGVRLSHGVMGHFGLNDEGCVNLYAYDIAKLPMWEQRIWAGFNIAPSGKVSTELMDAQMRAEPASTLAPEQYLPSALKAVDDAFRGWAGQPLFRKHDKMGEILASVHRFRALEGNGVLALSKDIARLTADAIDQNTLSKLLHPPKGDRWGSLKHLERVLALKVDAVEARSLTRVLAGVYELRLGDAHLPTGKIEEAYGLIGLDRHWPPLVLGINLLIETVNCLCGIASALTEPQGSTSTPTA